MLKFSGIFLIFTLFVLFSGNFILADGNRELDEAEESCAAEFKVDLVKYRGIVKNRVKDIDNNTKCTIKCVLDKTKVLNNGKIDLEKLALVSHFNDATKLKDIQECDNVTADEPCIQAFMIHECMMDKFEKLMTKM